MMVESADGYGRVNLWFLHSRRGLKAEDMRRFELYAYFARVVFMVFICSSTKICRSRRVRGAIDVFETSMGGFELTMVRVHPRIVVYACGRFGDHWGILSKRDRRVEK